MAEYQITEVEGVRIHEGTPEQFHVGITQSTIERIIKFGEVPGDALALYVFYAAAAKFQNNTCPWANATFCKTGLKWGKARFQTAKNVLKKLSLIDDEPRIDEKTGKIKKWYVRVRYALSTSTETHWVSKSPTGSDTLNTIYSQGNTKNLNINTNEEERIVISSEEARAIFDEYRKKLSLNNR